MMGHISQNILNFLTSGGITKIALQRDVMTYELKMWVFFS